MSRRVSVILSTFNRAAWVGQAVESVLGQQGVDLELIVVDDASSDGTADYLRSIRDTRVRVIAHPHNVGMCAAVNSGLAAAEGDWLALIDDDDVWAPDKVLRQLEAVEAERRHWSITGCIYLDADLQVLGGKPPPPPAVLAQRNLTEYSLEGGTSAFLWRRGVLESDSINHEVPNMSDWELSLRLFAVGLPAVVPSPLVGYRQHNTAMSQKTDVFLVELERMSEIDHRIDPDRTRPYIHGFIGSQLLRRQERLAAARHFARAAVGGNLRALPRLVALSLPQPTQRWLRRRLLSDPEWMALAERWVGPLRERLHGNR